GTLYAWSESGSSILHSFAGGASGSSPRGEVYYDAASQELWGTTAGGGGTGCGTVFRRPLTGSLSVVHSFACATGSAPRSGLVADSAGRLWGTTYGSYSSAASVFRIDRSVPSVALVHGFPGGQNYVRCRLLFASDGRVYGTNEGVSNRPNRGTVYRIDPANGDAFETVRAFGLADPGWEPQSLAAGSDGALYGTTHYGGNL